MIYWLDQQMNHADTPNENLGRELLELFSMGIGDYTEEDVKERARAFTGWTKSQTIPTYPSGFSMRTSVGTILVKPESTEGHRWTA